MHLLANGMLLRFEASFLLEDSTFSKNNGKKAISRRKGQPASCGSTRAQQNGAKTNTGYIKTTTSILVATTK
jgi:hypothetical protein